MQADEGDDMLDQFDGIQEDNGGMDEKMSRVKTERSGTGGEEQDSKRIDGERTVEASTTQSGTTAKNTRKEEVRR